MSDRSRAWLPWLPWVVTVLFVATALLLPFNRSVPQESVDDGWAFFLLLLLQALTFATVGLVLARARPDNAVSWLFAFVGISVGLYLVAERYQYLALEVRPTLPFGELAAWLQSWTFVPALGVIVTLLPQLFPTGRPLSRRWYPALALGMVGSLGLLLADALKPGKLNQSSIANPYGIDPQHYAALEVVAPSLYVVAALVGFVCLLVRWRRAQRDERQQLKWFAYFAVFLPLFVLSNVVVELFGLHDTPAAALPLLLAVGAFLGLPIAVAVSILRYRLYDIDLVINRTLVYAILTAVLVTTYLGSVLAFRVVLDPLTGESDLAVAASTLAVAALFRPLRGRVQSVVDRRFYRSRYDAARTLDDFSARLRHEVDLDSLGTDLRAVVHETVRPTHVSLWIRDVP
jgi:hypothetical protein